MDVRLIGVLEDGYLKTSVPINLVGNTSCNFIAVNNISLSATHLFRLVLKQAWVLPVNILSISAQLNASGVQIKWKVASEKAIHTYKVELSADGRHFVTAGTVAAAGNITCLFCTLRANKPNTGNINVIAYHQLFKFPYRLFYEAFKAFATFLYLPKDLLWNLH